MTQQLNRNTQPESNDPSISFKVLDHAISDRASQFEEPERDLTKLISAFRAFSKSRGILQKELDKLPTDAYLYLLAYHAVLEGTAPDGLIDAGYGVLLEAANERFAELLERLASMGDITKKSLAEIHAVFYGLPSNGCTGFSSDKVFIARIIPALVARSHSQRLRAEAILLAPIAPNEEYKPEDIFFHTFHINGEDANVASKVLNALIEVLKK